MIRTLIGRNTEDRFQVSNFRWNDRTCIIIDMISRLLLYRKCVYMNILIYFEMKQFQMFTKFIAVPGRQVELKYSVTVSTVDIKITNNKYKMRI